MSKYVTMRLLFPLNRKIKLDIVILLLMLILSICCHSIRGHRLTLLLSRYTTAKKRSLAVTLPDNRL